MSEIAYTAISNNINNINNDISNIISKIQEKLEVECNEPNVPINTITDEGNLKSNQIRLIYDNGTVIIIEI